MLSRGLGRTNSRFGFCSLGCSLDQGERFLATVAGAVLSNQQPCDLLSPDVPISRTTPLDGLNSLLKSKAER